MTDNSNTTNAPIDRKIHCRCGLTLELHSVYEMVMLCPRCGSRWWLAPAWPMKNTTASI